MDREPDFADWCLALFVWVVLAGCIWAGTDWIVDATLRHFGITQKLLEARLWFVTDVLTYAVFASPFLLYGGLKWLEAREKRDRERKRRWQLELARAQLASAAIRKAEREREAQVEALVRMYEEAEARDCLLEAERRAERERRRREAQEAQRRAREAELALREAIASKPNMPPASDALEPPEADEDQVWELEPRELSHAEWHASSDPLELLGHAVTRIPRQHLCLVLSEFAMEIWPEFHAHLPNDWRLSWCITTLRAWCFGEATLEEVERARAATKQIDIRDRGRKPWSVSAYFALIAAGWASAYADTAPIDVNDLYPARRTIGSAAHVRTSFASNAVDAALDVAEHARSAVSRAYVSFRYGEERAAELVKPLERAVLAEFADRIRARIPWVARPSQRWELHDGWVQSGDATLILDGWRVVEAKPFFPERRGRSAVRC